MLQPSIINSVFVRLFSTGIDLAQMLSAGVVTSLIQISPSLSPKLPGARATGANDLGYFGAGARGAGARRFRVERM